MKHKLPEGTSPKQYMVDLVAAGKLTKLQLRAGSRMLDALLAEGKPREKALNQVLKALDKGKVKLGAKDPQAQKNLPKLADVDENASPKQKLLELRKAGSISPIECRTAAEAVDAGKSLESALVAAGAERVLDEVPPTQELTDGDDADDSGDGDSGRAGEGAAGDETGAVGAAGGDATGSEAGGGGEGEDEAEGDGGGAGGVDSQPSGLAKATTLADVLKGNVASTKAAIDKINHMPAVLSLLELEAQDKDRKGVKTHLIERLEASGQYDDATIARAAAGGGHEAATVDNAAADFEE